MAQKLVPVTADLVRELKRRGDTHLAYELLQAFRDNAKENKKQLSRELNRKDRDVKRFQHLCTEPGCFEQLHKSGRCVKHYDLHQESRRKNFVPLKKKKVHTQYLIHVAGVSIWTTIHVRTTGEVITNFNRRY